MKYIRLNSRGFSLVEMALVLVVIGIVIGIGAGMIGPLTTMSKVRESREVVESDIASVTSWAASNNRLPAFVPSAPDTARFDQIVKSPIDSWGHPLMYLFDANLAPTGANLPTKDTICGRRTTAIRITDNTTVPAVTINNVAFTIITQGEDALTQTTLNGTLNGAALNGVITGSGATTGMITLDPTVSDIIRWITLDELRSKIGCQGAQLKIVNNELPATSLGSTYSVNIFADGGVPVIYTPPLPAPPQNQYRWCVEVNSRQSAQGLPNGVIFAPNFIRYPNDINAPTRCINQPESAWPNWATNLVVTKSVNSTDTGSFSFTIYARDNNNTSLTSVSCSDTSASTNRDNCVNKAFVLTISP